MPGKEEVRILLNELGNQVRESSEDKPLEPVIAERSLTFYKRHGAFPGDGFTLVGYSCNVEYRLLGTESEARRKACITLMLERKGSSSQCMRLFDAFEFDGFLDILGDLEQNRLKQLPEETYIGPAFDRWGNRIRSAFAVWQPIQREKQREVRLLQSSRA